MLEVDICRIFIEILIYFQIIESTCERCGFGDYHECNDKEVSLIQEKIRKNNSYFVLNYLCLICNIETIHIHNIRCDQLIIETTTQVSYFYG